MFIEQRPMKVLGLCALIAAISLLLTLFIPGYVALLGGVFYKEDITAKLPPPATKAIEDFKRKQAKISAQIAAIDIHLQRSKQATSAELSSLLELRSHLNEQSERSTSPITVIPFYLNPQMLLWPAIYTCLGWLVFLFRPPQVQASKSFTYRLRTLFVGSAIYCGYEWPLWVRNFVLATQGRTVYAYPNHDIHPASFWAQELTILGFCMLLAVLWRQWSLFLHIRRCELNLKPEKAVEATFDHHILDRLSATFGHWQVCSLVLALGFLFFTHFFWSIVARYQDQRYLLSAIFAHALWGISWILLSLPMLVTWQHWENIRNRALTEVATGINLRGETTETTLKVLLELRPLSIWSVGASGAGAFISFVLPIIQMLKGS